MLTVQNEHQNFGRIPSSYNKPVNCFSENLTEELRQVIQELNQNIADQFGENFEHLTKPSSALLNGKRTTKTTSISWMMRSKIHWTVSTKQRPHWGHLRRAQQMIQIRWIHSEIPEGFAQQNEQLNEQLSALAQMRAEVAEVFYTWWASARCCWNHWRVGKPVRRTWRTGRAGDYQPEWSDLQTLADSQATQENMLEQTRAI